MSRHGMILCFDPQLPDLAIEVFDELIDECIVEGVAEFNESSVRDRLIKKGLSKDKLPRRGLSSITKLYESAGWGISYCRPTENHTGHYFIFVHPSKVNKEISE